jgi:predicted transcriptional regulator
MTPLESEIYIDGTRHFAISVPDRSNQLKSAWDLDQAENTRVSIVIGNNVNHNKSVDDLITELRQRTAELEEANRELRRLSHYRSLFLARCRTNCGRRLRQSSVQ